MFLCYKVYGLNNNKDAKLSQTTCSRFCVLQMVGGHLYCLDEKNEWGCIIWTDQILQSDVRTIMFYTQQRGGCKIHRNKKVAINFDPLPPSC